MTKHSSAFLLAALLALLFAGGPAETAGGASVEIFNPQGYVRQVRQVTARFSEAMVALGDPRTSGPFEITAAIKGSGRWLDERTWVYDFERDLPAAQLCEFKLRPGLRSLAGNALAGRQIFSFATGGPEVEQVLAPEDADEIDAEQVFILRTSAPVNAETIQKRVYFTVQDRPEKIEVQLLEAAQRSAMLKAARVPDEAGLVVIKARQAFAAERAVKLVWAAGVTAPNGVANLHDQVLDFKTREPFKAQLYGNTERGGYLPVVPLNLSFNAPVKADKLAGLELVSATGQVFKPSIEPDETGCVSEVSFAAPLPENTRFTLSLPAGLADTDGRALSNAASFPLNLRTGPAPALAKFSARFGIIEAANAVLPLTVRNIETRCAPAKPAQTSKAKPAGPRPELHFRLYSVARDDRAIINWLKRVAGAQREKSILKTQKRAREISLPERQASRSLEVIGVPLAGPGLYVAELDSRLLGSTHFKQPAPMFVPTAALVTDLAAHFKWGRENSLVWVTRLSDGQPVKAAQVSIRTTRGKLVWQGATDARGIAQIDSELKEGPATETEVNWGEIPRALESLDSGLFVFVRSGSDLTFTHSSWDEGIETWRFQLPEAEVDGPGGLSAHTILDRSLFRSGETVHMRHLMRQRTAAGFSLPAAAKLPQEALIEHLGSQQSYRVKLDWSPGASAVCEWQIPAGAKLGSYSITLGKDREGDGYRTIWSTGQFKVADFRVPLMRAVLKPAASRYIRPTAIDLDLGLSYLAGGAAANQPVKLRSQLQEKFLSFAGYEQFNFTGAPLKEGLSVLEDDEQAQAGEAAQSRFETRELKLDAAGALRTQISGLPTIESPKQLLAELEYADPSGETQTSATRVNLYPAGCAVGLKTDFWAGEASQTTYQIVVLDLDGRPLKNVPVKLSLYRETILTHRARLVGGFYSYQNTREIKRVGEPITLTTDSRGLIFNQQACPVSGSIIIQAEARDARGNPAYANANVYVAGRDEWWFAQANDDRIDVIPEERRYEPGQPARFQVRMPFRRAQVLVTVEREGVLDAYIREVAGQNPVIEIPVKANYAPNVFVSVLAVRGRLGETRPTATFDPGKPAFKLGYGEILVGHKAHQLEVRVVPDKTSYQVRDEMQVQVQVRDATSGQAAGGGEVTLAAVDEGLLELSDNPSWQLLEALLRRRGCEVNTATAQSMVVGKRHFGLKAVAAGGSGGGGRQPTRELFDTLLFWRGATPLDAKGEARFNIKLNDSLTAFKLVAVATCGADKFGTGSATVTTTQELMLLPGLAPLVREGDRFAAGCTVRNAGQRKLRVRVELGLAAAKPGLKLRQPAAQTIVLKPGEARELSWDVLAPPAAERLDYVFSASTDGGPSDRVKLSQRVVPLVPVRTYQATLRQVSQAEPLSLTLARPLGALPERGGISVSLRPSLRGSLSGVNAYLQAYPYTCLEQRVSCAVGLHDQKLWNGVVKDLPTYLDDKGLLKYFARMDQGSDSLTAYVLSISQQAGLTLPADLREQMLDGLKAFVEGRHRPRVTLDAADTVLRKLSALEAIARYRPLTPELVSSIAVRPEHWPTSAVIDWVEILKRNPQLPESKARLNAALQVLRTRLTLHGTTMGFSTEKRDGLWWLMVSGDQNCLRAILALLPYQAWQDDLPRMLRGALGRMRGSHWDTTTANAWGVLATDAFAKRFEAAPVTGQTTAGFAAPSQVAWQQFPRGADLSWGWAAKPAQLKLSHAGAGAPWVMISSRAAIPLKNAFTSGYSISKTVTPLQQRRPGVWSRGDVVRIRLDLKAQGDMTWVALNEPVPGGASILSAGLFKGGEREGGRVWEAYREPSFGQLKIYYEYVPKGAWQVEYTLRLNNPGEFQLPPTRLEALYAPEVCGELPNRAFSIRP